MNNTSFLDVKTNATLDSFIAVGGYDKPLFYDIAAISNILITCTITFMLGIIGVVTNILNMLVLLRHGMDDSTNIVLLGLSVSDMLYSCGETFVRIVYITVRLDFTLAFNLSSFYFVYLMNVSNYAMATSVWLVSLISVERMVAVCFPFKASRLITNQRMMFMVLFVYVFLSGLYCLAWCRYYIQWSCDNLYNITGYTVFERQFYTDNPWILNTLKYYIVPALVSSAAMITILLCTIATVTQLGKATKNIGNISTSKIQRAKEMRSIKISLIICCTMAFTILIPNACLDAYPAIKGDDIPTYVMSFIMELTELAAQFNASMNFFIYVALSSKFMKTSLKVIHCN